MCLKKKFGRLIHRSIKAKIFLGCQSKSARRILTLNLRNGTAIIEWIPDFDSKIEIFRRFSCGNTVEHQRTIRWINWKHDNYRISEKLKLTAPVCIKIRAKMLKKSSTRSSKLLQLRGLIACHNNLFEKKSLKLTSASFIRARKLINFYRYHL